jgi:hypothetical protein
MAGKVHDKVAATLNTRTASKPDRPIVHALKFVFFIFIVNLSLCLLKRTRVGSVRLNRDGGRSALTFTTYS